MSESAYYIGKKIYKTVYSKKFQEVNFINLLYEMKYFLMSFLNILKQKSTKFNSLENILLYIWF